MSAVCSVTYPHRRNILSVEFKEERASGCQKTDEKSNFARLTSNLTHAIHISAVGLL